MTPNGWIFVQDLSPEAQRPLSQRVPTRLFQASSKSLGRFLVRRQRRALQRAEKAKKMLLKLSFCLWFIESEDENVPKSDA